MKFHPENPSANNLSSGIDEGAVLSALQRSGYPLQGAVGSFMRDKGFVVQDEWCYRAYDSGELRALDLVATRELHQLGRRPQPRVAPHLTVFVECKRSDMPYVFLSTSPPAYLYDFPYFSGLHKYDIRVRSKGVSAWTSVQHGLGLHTLPFFRDSVRFASVFAKCVRKGASLELSGSDAFLSIVMPLMKAMHHHRQVVKPIETCRYFDAHICIALGVIDAPML